MAEEGTQPPRKPSYVTREEYEALLARVRALEDELGTTAPIETKVETAPALPRAPAPLPWPPVPTPPVQHQPALAPPPPPPPARPAPFPSPAPLARVPPPAPSAPAAKRDVSVESLLGQRWAPRVGALLVFLATLFFLGVAIQRGWIGPVAQLAIAALGAAGLLAWGAVLTRKRGYGVYPQILEGTGAAVLYVTSFVAYAVPYYSDETRLTALGGGLLMAAVAAGTLALALHRDARAIAALGYVLSFLTAGFGTTVLPAITLAYVALLGASLAIVVQRKGWLNEAVLGTAATGALFLVVASDPAGRGAPNAWWVLACALAPLAAFSWLTLQRPAASGAKNVLSPAALAAIVAGVSAVWATALALRVAGEDHVAQGYALLALCATETGLATAAATRRAGRPTLAAYGVAATTLYLLWPPNLWSAAPEHDLLVTSSYALAALALAGLVTLRPRLRDSTALLWPTGALVLAATLRALLVDDRLHAPWLAAGGDVVGSWQAWLTFALLAPPIALLAAASFPSARSAHRGPMVALGVAFAGAWAFALFVAPLAVTSWLLLLAAAAVAFALLRNDSATEFAFAAAALALVATAKSAVFDAGLSVGEVYAEGILLAVALVAFFQAVVAPRLAIAKEARNALVALLLLAYGAGLAALWRDAQNGRVATTAAFALGSLALGVLARMRRAREQSDAAGDEWLAAFSLGAAAAGYALLFNGRLVAPWDVVDDAAGPWDAWMLLALVAAALWLVVAARASDRTLRRGALAILLAFLALWTFALLHAPFLVTAALLVVAALASSAGAMLPDDPERATLARDALVGAILVAVLAGAKGATWDAYGPRALAWPLAALETALTAGALLALHALARRQRPAVLPEPLAPAVLVGGSALVIANDVLAYASGPWPSILLAALGVCYLAAGFVLRRESVLRYTGFALLGFVLVRLFAVDLGQTDLAIRALVFAVLGAILLGVGFAYARLNRRKDEPAAAQDEAAVPFEDLTGR